MTAKSKEKKRAAKVRRAMVGGGRGNSRPKFREGVVAFMYLIEHGKKPE